MILRVDGERERRGQSASNEQEQDERMSDELIAEKGDLVKSIGVPLLSFLELESEAGDPSKTMKMISSGFWTARDETSKLTD